MASASETELNAAYASGAVQALFFAVTMYEEGAGDQIGILLADSIKEYSKQGITLDVTLDKGILLDEDYDAGLAGDEADKA